MTKIVSFFTALQMALLAFFGIPFNAPDLEPLEPVEVVATEAQIQLFEDIFQSETQWLASLQLENGAIPMTYSKNGRLTMNPYFADFAALALLDDAEKYIDDVQKNLKVGENEEYVMLADDAVLSLGFHRILSLWIISIYGEADHRSFCLLHERSKW